METKLISAKAKVVIILVATLCISLYASGFIWQHVLPDLETKVIRTEQEVEYVSNEVEWILVPSGVILFGWNIALLMSIMWVNIEWDEYDAEEILNKLSIVRKSK